MNARRVTLASLMTLCGLMGGLASSSAPALAAAPEAPAPVTVEALKSTSAKFQGELNPGKAGPAGTYELGTYEFLYKKSATECKGGKKAPEPPGMSLGGGEEALPAQEVSGLEPETEYTVCLVANNEAAEPTVGPPVTFTTLPPLRIDSEFASDVASSSATLQAQINPLGSDTSAYFQYGSVSCAASPESCVDVPVAPGTDLGSAESDQALSAHLQNLAPAAIYHYRVVAVNALGTIYGNDKTFTTQSSGNEFALPDGRQYEMVSPPLKDGAEILGIIGNGEASEGGRVRGAPGATGAVQAAEDGTGITYLASAPAGADEVGNVAASQILSTRGATGWSSQDIEAPWPIVPTLVTGSGEEYRLFSGDLSRAVLQRPQYFNAEPSLAPEVHGATKGL